MPAPSCASQPQFSIRRPVVGLLPPRLEWEVNPSHAAGSPYFLVGCIGVLGLRSTQSHLKMVSAAVARLLDAAPHSGQRNGANSNRSGSMGSGVECIHSPGILRQYGSCWCHNCGAGPRSTPHAPATMPTLLLCTLRHSIASSAHSRGSKHCSRCTIEGQA